MGLTNRRLILFITIIAMLGTFVISISILSTTIHHYIMLSTERIVQSYASYIKSSLNSIIVSHIETTNSSYFQLLNQQLQYIREQNKDITDIMILKMIVVKDGNIQTIILSNSFDIQSEKQVQLSYHPTDTFLKPIIENDKTLFRKEYDKLQKTDVYQYYCRYYKEKNTYYILKVEIPTTYQSGLFYQFKSTLRIVVTIVLIFIMLLLFFLFI